MGDILGGDPGAKGLATRVRSENCGSHPLDIFHPPTAQSRGCPASLFSAPVTVVAPSHLVRSQDPGQRRVLDRAARQRRINRQLEALENDNFQDDPHAGLPQLGKRLPQFDDDADTGEAGGGGRGCRGGQWRWGLGGKAAGRGKSLAGSGLCKDVGLGDGWPASSFGSLEPSPVPVSASVSLPVCRIKKPGQMSP